MAQSSVAVYSSSTNMKATYNTDKHMESILQMMVKDIYNLMLPEDINHVSSNSIRVNTCVSLHSFRNDGDFIKLWL
eukprot:2213311-Ditylum_brightwellii.AAC.1